MVPIGWDWDLDPWRNLGRLGRELAGRESVAAEAYPPVNVYESAEAYGLEAEIPGGASDKLELTVEGNTLTLSGELGFAEGKSQYHRRERPVGRFARAIRFPLGLDPAGVEAHYSDGILTVRLAKAPEAKARKIAVRAG